MSWAKPFYQRQAELCSDCYYYEVGSYSRDKVALLKELNLEDKNILDIGAGSGQNAIAMADFSKSVLALELIVDFVSFGKKLIDKEEVNNCQIIMGDFYDFRTEKKFDLVTYWDGFGVGNDDEQRRLLSNISNWIHADGRVLIEIYTPWYADYSKGKEMTFGEAKRQYGFDYENCRWLDRWWKIGDEVNSIFQSLRCYSPADLKLLIEGIDLEIEMIRPCLNWKDFEHLYSGELATAVSYVAIFKKKGKAR